MRDLSSSTWVIPRFLGKRVIKRKLVQNLLALIEPDVLALE
jgi:hypothetical protein